MRCLLRRKRPWPATRTPPLLAALWRRRAVRCVATPHALCCARQRKRCTRTSARARGGGSCNRLLPARQRQCCPAGSRQRGSGQAREAGRHVRYQRSRLRRSALACAAGHHLRLELVEAAAMHHATLYRASEISEKPFTRSPRQQGRGVSAARRCRAPWPS